MARQGVGRSDDATAVTVGTAVAVGRGDIEWIFNRQKQQTWVWWGNSGQKEGVPGITLFPSLDHWVEEGVLNVPGGEGGKERSE